MLSVTLVEAASPAYLNFVSDHNCGHSYTDIVRYSPSVHVATLTCINTWRANSNLTGDKAGKNSQPVTLDWEAGRAAHPGIQSVHAVDARRQAGHQTCIGPQSCIAGPNWRSRKCICAIAACINITELNQLAVSIHCQLSLKVIDTLVSLIVFHPNDCNAIGWPSSSLEMDVAYKQSLRLPV